MKNILTCILEDAKKAYKESILVDNEILEEKILSIIGNTKSLLNEFKNVNYKNSLENKDKKNIELKAIEKVKRKVPLWLTRPHQRNYKILKSYMLLSDNDKYSVSLSLLEKESGLKSKEFTSHYNQMKTFAEKAHGKIFIETNGKVRLWEPVANIIIEQFKITNENN